MRVPCDLEGAISKVHILPNDQNFSESELQNGEPEVLGAIWGNALDREEHLHPT